MDQAEFNQALTTTGIPDVSVIMAYGEGSLDDNQVIEMVQHGINPGWIWSLQGHYGRLASDLIKNGSCTRSAT